MIKILSVAEFLDSGLPIIDVRSPSEFTESHVSNAINLPLLNDTHRAKVGKTFKQEGREAAIQLGYALINPIRDKLLSEMKEMVQGNHIGLYCARGGLRSGNMAKFYSENGYQVNVLKGGYKAYRNYILNTIKSFNSIIILSGYTGSGKTEILKALQFKRAQVLDLEALAFHKGSAFGGLGNTMQPSSAQFHNAVFDALKVFDTEKPLWIENESFTIGKVVLPNVLWENMKIASGVEILLPIHERLNFTLDQYGKYKSTELIACVKNLRRRLGDEETNDLCALIEEGNLPPVVLRLFKYYDKAYELGRKKRNCHHYVKIPFETLDTMKIAEILISSEKEYLNQFT